jgi:hypothetical protein
VIHETLLVTDQAHSRPAVTVNRPFPPEAPTDDIEFATVIVHLSRDDGFVTIVEDVPHAPPRKATTTVKLKETSLILDCTFITIRIVVARHRER